MTQIALLLALCATLTSIYVLWWTLCACNAQGSRVERLEREWLKQRHIYRQWYVDTTEYENKYAALHQNGNYVAPEPPPLLR